MFSLMVVMVEWGCTKGERGCLWNVSEPASFIISLTQQTLLLCSTLRLSVILPTQGDLGQGASQHSYDANHMQEYYFFLVAIKKKRKPDMGLFPSQIHDVRGPHSPGNTCSGWNRTVRKWLSLVTSIVLSPYCDAYAVPIFDSPCCI